MFQPKLVMRMVLAGALTTEMALTGCNTMVNIHENLLSDEPLPVLTHPRNVTSDLRVALEGAGMDMLLSPSTVRIGNRTILRTSYAYGKDGIETIYEASDVTVAIHKGRDYHESPYTEADVTVPSDYYGQDEQWSLDVDGTVVNCHGREMGQAQGVEWIVRGDGKEEFFMMVVQSAEDDASDIAMEDDAVEAMVRSTR